MVKYTRRGDGGERSSCRSADEILGLTAHTQKLTESSYVCRGIMIILLFMLKASPFEQRCIRVDLVWKEKVERSGNIVGTSLQRRHPHGGRLRRESCNKLAVMLSIECTEAF